MKYEDIREIMYQACEDNDIPLTHENSEIVMILAKSVVEAKAGQHETIVMCAEIDVGMKAGTWQPKFTIGNQTFWLSECENKESAEWMSDQLRKALKNLCKMQRNLCYKAVKDRVDYHAP